MPQLVFVVLYALPHDAPVPQYASPIDTAGGLLKGCGNVHDVLPTYKAPYGLDMEAPSFFICQQIWTPFPYRIHSPLLLDP